MAAGPVGSGICLKHDKVWRSKFQSYMNNISGPARRNPLIGPSDIKKITKAVCICNQDVNQKWSQISNNLAEAHRVFQQNFMRSAIHDISRQSLKELYEHFRSNNMFTGSGSADRLIFIFMVKEGHITTTSDILNNICPTSRNQSRATNVHLGSLRRSHIGRFIGRGGTGIREAVHGIPVGNIALNFINENEGHVEVRATYSCRRRNGPRIRAALDHRLRFYQNEVPIPVRFRERFNPSTVRPATQEEDDDEVIEGVITVLDYPFGSDLLLVEAGYHPEEITDLRRVTDQLFHITGLFIKPPSHFFLQMFELTP